MRLPLLSVGIVLGLNACTTLGPDYQREQSAVIDTQSAQAEFIQAQNKQLFDNTSAPDQWWYLFDDAKANSLVEIAIQNNNSIKQALANLEKSQALLVHTDASTGVQTTVSAGTDFGHPSGVDELAPTYRPPNEWIYSSKLNVSYQLDFWGQEKRQLESTYAQAQSQAAALHQAQIIVVANVLSAYAELCEIGEALELKNEQIVLQKNYLTTQKRYINAGKLALGDDAQALENLYTLQAGIPTLKSKQEHVFYYLAMLLAKSPQDLDPSYKQCKRTLQIKQALPVGDGQTLLARRPDIAQAEFLAQAATFKVGVAEANLYPKINFGFSAGSGGPSSIVGERGTWSWGIGPLISWTIPNREQAKSEVAMAQASLRAEIANFDQVVLNALRETESALVKYQSLREQSRSVDAAQAQANRYLTQQQRLFKAGKLDYFHVLDAQRNVLAIRQNQSQLAGELTLAQINLFLALGGGWQNSTPAQGIQQQ